MEDDNPPGKEDEPPERISDRVEPSPAEVNATTTTITTTTTTTTTTEKCDGAMNNQVLPILNHTPVKPLPKGKLTPEGRKYRLLYDELKVKYRQLLAKNQETEEKVKKSEELLQKFAIENESLRQKNEATENGCLQLTPEVSPVIMKMTNEDIFIAKPKKSTRNQKSSSDTCAISGCENMNIDLIKCNLCGNPICEDCSSVKFTKLRPVMNQCSTLYFTCKCCDGLMREEDVNVYDQMKSQITTLKEELNSCERQNERLSSDANASQRLQQTCEKLTDENKSLTAKVDLQNTIVQKSHQEHSLCKGRINNLNQQVKTLTDHQTSLRLLLGEREKSLHEADAKLVSLEENRDSTSRPMNGEVNIEELINKRFDKIDKNIDAMIEKKLAECCDPSHPSVSEASKKLFSAAVGATPNAAVTPNVTTTIATSRNAELIEKREQEKRANNIIIYGLSEERVDDNVPIEEQDKEFLSSFLETLEVNVVPKQTTRLGNAQAGKNRPIKVTMKSAADKNKIMSSLNKLKNANEPLRGISVREDYTIEERQLIKSMTEEAKRKNEAENVTHWKVRGTPKNGLRVVKITCKQT